VEKALTGQRISIVEWRMRSADVQQPVDQEGYQRSKDEDLQEPTEEDEGLAPDQVEGKKTSEGMHG
jgi:hypothetical protein